MRRISANGCEITILPVVKGLVAEGDEVAKAVKDLCPDVVALSISKEELSALRNKVNYEDYEMADLEEVYAAHLEAFGDVELPPPCFVSAVDACAGASIPVVPLDMNDEVFTEAYCSSVRTRDMIRESFFARRALKRKFDLSSPQAFARDWDEKVNKAKGFQELERQRERHMAEALSNLCRRYRRILAVIECERVPGVETVLAARDTQGAEVK